MPTVKWEWQVTPQTVISLMNFLGILVVAVSFIVGARSDATSATASVSELKAAVQVVRESQISTTERIAKVETKVDIMLPSVQRIENTLRAPPIK